MSTPKGRILHPTDASVSNEKIQALVKEGADKARAAGYEVPLTFVEPVDLSASMTALRQSLQSGDWDALIVSGALGVTPAYTPQFERTINMLPRKQEYSSRRAWRYLRDNPERS
ncbi:hypothetical protein CLAFUW4_01967 [Fulvia fulva]|uniref:Uncharacterized protein n=1 Tax=Passalora fulva TaxID=5499 RepID=A0A9Q8L7N9_PASFU|nr:uncharacterized protein CLAFUR5_01961 [Fulvia fulva]KAK4634097.1 hypothetical protein CLAFUR4_01962 [Fulvia fulva]KAK4637587.1 hypothetical protein CLAFUR0_01964 [Fulvia fulva]UJO12382.1 hypothetical protein CLAFUR5_01961 [Fulvia fulva]WPV08541.1 hypothetical protein CLAFUW4_01967 [Fulvia fulva]WPV24860.1 hypothetical protein CLAFUW7_01966 [Fulvia fulva]